LHGLAVVQGRFDDFSLLREAVHGWDLDWRQLDAGKLSARLLQLKAALAMHSAFRFSRKFYQRGSTPAGMGTLGLIEKGVTGVRWCGQEVTDQHILCFASSGEFEAVSQPDFAAHTLSYPEEHLAYVAETVGVPDSLRLLDRSRGAARSIGAAADAIRRRLHRICSEVTLRRSVLDSGGLEQELGFEIPAALLSALAASREGPRRKPPARARQMGFARAIAYIEDNADAPVTVEEVGKAAGVSLRTLNYAFREHLEVSPKKYIQALRLNAVRRELLAAGPPVKVVDAANRWGFWHMGQFAADFRKHFGELPSELLRPGRRSPRHS